MESTTQVVVIGAGLSGLYLSYLLNEQDIDFVLLEAGSRPGGRIHTVTGPLNTPLELGATWFSDIHVHLLSLISELGLTKYPQFSHGMSLFQTKSFEPPQKFFVPASDTPSYRIQGGTAKLIDALCEKLPEQRLRLNTEVSAIEDAGNGMKISTTQGETFYGRKVVICMPPQLVSRKIQFRPALPAALQEVIGAVHTWMAGALKFTLEYHAPFWRKNGYSGMLYSHAGIIMEMYDHTNCEETKFGFTGFLNPGAAAYTPEVRQELVLQQLTELLGDEAARPSAYFDKIWNDKLLQDGSPVIQRPHQHNGHPLLQQSYMNGRLLFCGAETSPSFGGYMEGAVISAQQVFDRLSK